MQKRHGGSMQGKMFQICIGCTTLPKCQTIYCVNLSIKQADLLIQILLGGGYEHMKQPLKCLLKTAAHLQCCAQRMLCSSLFILIHSGEHFQKSLFFSCVKQILVRTEGPREKMQFENVSLCENAVKERNTEFERRKIRVRERWESRTPELCCSGIVSPPLSLPLHHRGPLI